VKPESLSTFIFAGEKSGDLHGSGLMQALVHAVPDISFFGVGGPLMRKQGLNATLRMEDFEVMGLTDVLLSLPKLIKQFYFLRNEILRKKPPLVILIDYPGFNLRLAKALRAQGYQGKIVQYICPSVWAHGQHRIQLLADSFDLLLAILPFEPDYFKKTPLAVSYVGNPLLEYLSKYPYKDNWKLPYGIPEDHRLAAIFPGSRQGEIERNLPFLLKASALLKRDYPDLRFALSCAHENTSKLALPLSSALGLHIHKDIFLVSSDHSYELMRDAHCAIAKSGTVALELALHECPTLVVYQLSWLNRLFAKQILKLDLPHYALPNIVAGERIFPELIETGFSSENIHTALKPLIESPLARESCQQGCKKIKSMLNLHTASHTAAKKIKEMLAC
jgi:lipid-A-disaccharide synthase